MAITKRIAGIVAAIGLALAPIAVATPAMALPTTPAPTTTESGRQVTVTDGYFTSGDKYGTQIYFKENLVTNPVGNAVVVHGMAEHSGRYEYVVKKLNNAGFNVFRLDQRGHGRSAAPYVNNEIPKGYIDDFQNMLDDVNILVEKSKAEQPGLKTFMLGHSLGAFTTQGYALKYPHALDGVVTNGGGIPMNLSGQSGSPSVEVLNENIGEAERTAFAPLGALPLDTFTTFNGELAESMAQGEEFHAPSVPGSDMIKIPNPNGSLIHAAWDPAVNDESANDPLNGTYLTAGLLQQTVALMMYNSVNASEFQYPTLITHGDKDELVPLFMDVNWNNAISSKDKQFIIYNGQMHEVWNDYGKDEALDTTVNWLLKHL